MIYLDYNATTPIDKEVAMAMRPYLEGHFGNPSSTHHFGIEAKKAIEKARGQLASLLNCKPWEIIFTSGGTEANNMALRGIALAHQNNGKHIITSAIEHPAILEVCNYLEKNGFEITYLPVDQKGIVKLESLKEAIKQNTILVSIMHANNEIGSIQNISELASYTKSKGIIFHCDAAQSTGKIKTDVEAMNVDLLSIAGHKLYAPKGVGALYIRSGIAIEKILFGANHEQNLRPGTENVLEIVGLGKAAEIAKRDLEKNKTYYSELSLTLYNAIHSLIPDIIRNGDINNCLPNTLSLSFPGIEANTLVSRLDNIAVSAGAACHAENIEVSTVLEAIKLPIRIAMGTIRFSTGKYNTLEEMEIVARKISEVVSSLREGGNDMIQSENEEVRLTQFTHGLGCACKIKPAKLEMILKNLPVSQDKNILVGTTSSDDASVYKISEDIAIVQTLDFFTPIVDDPYDFGAIAAANALSDIYAMGAKAMYAQNIVAFPDHILGPEVLTAILKGASDKAAEAGIEIVGGHSIEDSEPKFGMVITGIIHPKKIITNHGGRPGDILILTKALGTGILATALKRNNLSDNQLSIMTKSMSMLNKTAAELMMDFDVNACTDVTGFGLLGHLYEMSSASKCNVNLNMASIPILPGVEKLIAAGIIPGGSQENLRHFGRHCEFKGISEVEKIILADAQTSGGLLISVEKHHANKLLKKLRELSINQSEIIGEFTAKGEGIITIS